MTERNIGRPWTEEEDRLLTEAVAIHGEHDNWKTIALSVQGRTNKACRKRWLHSLSPDVKKTAWTPDEDKHLLQLYSQHGPKWSTIARDIPGRTDDACSKRYREALDPSLKKDEWTPEEDVKLLQEYARIGGKWGQVGQELQRSGLACRNRWRLLERKKASEARAAQGAKSINISNPVDDDTRTEIENLAPSNSADYSPQSGLSHKDPIPIESHWPPYYPPEAYPTFPTEGSSREQASLCPPTPEALVTVSPHVAPFQFSSSSLSAALSDPPRLPRPLPPITVQNDMHDYHYEFEPLPSLSPLPLQHVVQDFSQDDSESMSLDDLAGSFEDQNDFTGILTATNYTPQHVHYFHNNNTTNIHDSAMYSSVSPISLPPEMSQTDPLLFDGSWKSPNPLSDLLLMSLFEQSPSPLHHFVGMPSLQESQDDLSSASSTPFAFSSSLSPTSSPSVASPKELPLNDGLAPGSLLFSSPNGSTLQLSGRPKRTSSAKRTNRAHTKSQALTRLSSMLPLTSDPSVRPYACGREMCWPATSATSSSCFATSKELFDHSKDSHADDLPGEKPFRCALSGCGKSWKSINGLQYHLQISTAHFKHALSTRFSSQITKTIDEEQSSPGDGKEIEIEDPDRTCVCPHPQCFKAYRQPSGLRYHLKHGHPEQMPAQLLEVPPALARQLPTKTKRMRSKSSPDSNDS